MTGRPRLTVFGTGYLGTAHAACLASLGFEVLGVDVDAGGGEDGATAAGTTAPRAAPATRPAFLRKGDATPGVVE